MAENRGVSVTDPFSGARAPQPAAIGPTMYDLPSESPEEPGLPDLYHLLQPRLLDETFKPPRIGRDSFFVAADVNLYFDRANPLYHKRPDWYAVLGTTPHYRDGALRLSYVVWDEGVAPLIVIELLSEGTEAEDLGRTQRRVGEPPTKWHVYEQVLRIPYYIVFGREEKVPRFFRLVEQRYRPVLPTPDRFWIAEAGLALGLWTGHFDYHTDTWLRWFDAAGVPVPTHAERAETERHQRLEAERLAEGERHQRLEAERLAEGERRQRLEAERRLAEMETRLRHLTRDP